MRDLLSIVEAAESLNKLVNAKLPYGIKDLEPVMSKDTLNYHHGKLAQSYADRFNKDEGDSDFNLAGNYLHNLFFPQFILYVSILRMRDLRVFDNFSNGGSFRDVF